MRTQAIIIKKYSSGEYDQLVSCYTQEFGKLTAVAKSSLKAYSAQSMHLDTLNLVSFDLISGRSFPIIIGAQEESTYPNIKKSLRALSISYFFLEVLDKIVYDHQADRQLWDFYSRLLDELEDDRGRASILFFRQKQAELLGTLGYPSEKTDKFSSYSVLDSAFEQTASKQMDSLKFLYNVLQ